jgi:hypothetical protein
MIVYNTNVGQVNSFYEFIVGDLFFSCTTFPSGCSKTSKNPLCTHHICTEGSAYSWVRHLKNNPITHVDSAVGSEVQLHPWCRHANNLRPISMGASRAYFSYQISSTARKTPRSRPLPYTAPLRLPSRHFTCNH